MLVSLEKMFIFVHVPKAAGTSIENILRQYCLPKNRTQWRRFSSNFPIREDVKKTYFRQHDTALMARRKMGRALFDDLTKFAVVRNPYDHAVSYYKYLRKDKENNRHKKTLSMSFLQYLQELEKSTKRSDQSYWLEDANGKLLVDNIIRFEDLEVGFEAICEKIGLPNLKLKKLNTTDPDNYQTYYKEKKTRAILERIYARDIKRFKYNLVP